MSKIEYFKIFDYLKNNVFKETKRKSMPVYFLNETIALIILLAMSLNEHQN
jgi:hypothetical protein